MLFPIDQVERDGEKWLVFESFSDSPFFRPEGLNFEGVTGAVIVIVAVTSSGGRDWAAYWAAHVLNGRNPEIRWEKTRRRGHKIPRAIAEVMFPHATEEWGYYRD